jgi:hypothetical protein
MSIEWRNNSKNMKKLKLTESFENEGNEKSIILNDIPDYDPKTQYYVNSIVMFQNLSDSSYNDSYIMIKDSRPGVAPSNSTVWALYIPGIDVNKTYCFGDILIYPSKQPVVYYNKEYFSYNPFISDAVDLTIYSKELSSPITLPSTNLTGNSQIIMNEIKNSSPKPVTLTISSSSNTGSAYLAFTSVSYQTAANYKNGIYSAKTITKTIQNDQRDLNSISINGDWVQIKTSESYEINSFSWDNSNTPTTNGYPKEIVLVYSIDEKDWVQAINITVPKLRKIKINLPFVIAGNYFRFIIKSTYSGNSSSAVISNLNFNAILQYTQYSNNYNIYKIDDAIVFFDPTISNPVYDQLGYAIYQNYNNAQLYSMKERSQAENPSTSSKWVQESFDYDPTKIYDGTNNNGLAQYIKFKGNFYLQIQSFIVAGVSPLEYPQLFIRIIPDTPLTNPSYWELINPNSRITPVNLEQTKDQLNLYNIQNYNLKTNYNVGDIVNYIGDLYTVTVESTIGKNPSSSQNWRPFINTYDSQKIYQIGDVIIYNKNPYILINYIGYNNAPPPFVNSSNWKSQKWYIYNIFRDEATPFLSTDVPQFIPPQALSLTNQTLNNVNYILSSTNQISNTAFITLPNYNRTGRYDDNGIERMFEYDTEKPPYTGSNTTTCNGVTVSGDWIQLQTSIPFKINSISWNNINTNNGDGRPSEVSIFWSVDGNLWGNIINVNLPNIETIKINLPYFVIPNYIRIVFKAAHYSKNSNIGIYNLQFYGAPVNPATIDLLSNNTLYNKEDFVIYNSQIYSSNTSNNSGSNINSSNFWTIVSSNFDYSKIYNLNDKVNYNGNLYFLTKKINTVGISPIMSPDIWYPIIPTPKTSDTNIMPSTISYTMPITMPITIPSSMPSLAIFFNKNLDGSQNKISLPLGDYDLNLMISKGIQNNSIHKVIVPPGLKVTLFSSGTFSGNSIVLYSNSISLDNLYMQASSFKIETAPTIPDTIQKPFVPNQFASVPAVVLYDSNNYTGKSAFVADGEYSSSSNLFQNQFGKNILKSIFIPSNKIVVLFSNDINSGPSIVLQNSYADLSQLLDKTISNGNWSNITSAMIIRSTDIIMLYRNINFQGTGYPITSVGSFASNSNLIQNQIGNDSLTSLIVPFQVQVTLFSDDINLGNSLTVNYPGISNLSLINDNTDIGFNWNKNTSSLIVNSTTNYNPVINNSSNLVATFFSRNSDGSDAGNVSLPIGNYELDAMKIAGIPNDGIYKVIVPPGLKVTLYSDGLGFGDSLVLKKSADSLTNLNMRTSSLKIETTPILSQAEEYAIIKAEEYATQESILRSQRLAQAEEYALQESIIRNQRMALAEQEQKISEIINSRPGPEDKDLIGVFISAGDFYGIGKIGNSTVWNNNLGVNYIDSNGNNIKDEIDHINTLIERGQNVIIDITDSNEVPQFNFFTNGTYEDNTRFDGVQKYPMFKIKSINLQVGTAPIYLSTYKIYYYIYPISEGKKFKKEYKKPRAIIDKAAPKRDTDIVDTTSNQNFMPEIGIPNGGYRNPDTLSSPQQSLAEQEFNDRKAKEDADRALIQAAEQAAEQARKNAAAIEDLARQTERDRLAKEDRDRLAKEEQDLEAARREILESREAIIRDALAREAEATRETEAAREREAEAAREREAEAAREREAEAARLAVEAAAREVEAAAREKARLAAEQEAAIAGSTQQPIQVIIPPVQNVDINPNPIPNVPLAQPDLPIPVFNLASFGNLQLWLDSSDAASIILSGSNVSQWNDKSGKSNNFTVAPNFNPPTMGGSGINFNSNQVMISSSPVSTDSNTTIFFVGNVNNLSDDFDYILGFSQQDLSFRWNPRNNFGDNSSGDFSADSGYTINGVVGANGTKNFNNKTLVNFVVQNGGSGQLTLSTDVNFGGDRFFKGVINELIIFNTPLSATQISQIQSYLAIKWNLQIISSFDGFENTQTDYLTIIGWILVFIIVIILIYHIVNNRKGYI